MFLGLTNDAHDAARDMTELIAYAYVQSATMGGHGTPVAEDEMNVIRYWCRCSQEDAFAACHRLARRGELEIVEIAENYIGFRIPGGKSDE